MLCLKESGQKKEDVRAVCLRYGRTNYGKLETKNTTRIQRIKREV